MIWSIETENHGLNCAIVLLHQFDEVSRNDIFDG